MYLFLFLIAMLGAGLYLTLILRLVPGAAEERLGALEELPPDLGLWKTDETSALAQSARAEGLIRQVRVCLQASDGLFSSERLTRQTRYCDVTTHEIVRVDPEEVLKRRRIRR
jgi:hypothetical protein